MPDLTALEFTRFQRFIYDAAGISLSASKKDLVSGRLAKRLAVCGVSSYGEYFSLVNRSDSGHERQTAIDLLTTNETYFFREPKHFEFLKRYFLSNRITSNPVRIWSAAGSTGEEAYSVAMTLADVFPAHPWEVVGSDISIAVLERASRGHYSTARTDNIPENYLKRYCRKGKGLQEGTLLIDRGLRSRVKFVHVNLNATLPPLGLFDVVLLRNVLIYFDKPTKQGVVERVLEILRPQGLLFISHTESLTGIADSLETISPSIFRRCL